MGRTTHRAGAVSLVALLALCGCAAAGSGDRPTTTATTPTRPTVAPPSSQSAAPSPSRGSAPASPTAAPTAASPTTDPAQVAVQLTSAAWSAADQAVEVSAFVPVVEEGGTCTVTLTSGSRSAQASGPAYPDASSTSCGLLSVPAAQLGSGTWTAVVTYRSSLTRAISDPTPVEVP